MGLKIPISPPFVDMFRGIIIAFIKKLILHCWPINLNIALVQLYESSVDRKLWVLYRSIAAKNNIFLAHIREEINKRKCS